MTNLVSDTPRVSVVFPAYNEEMYLPLMLWTLSRLNTTTPIEIIGVNNASTDRTWEIIEQSWIKRIDESRKWVSYARQAWLEVARGEIVATTDADTQVPETWIDANIKYFDNDTELVCFSSWVQFTRPHISYYLAREVYLLIKYIISSHSGDPTRIQSWPWANTFYKRETAIRAHWYELWSNMGEDNKIAHSMKNYWKIQRIDNEKSWIPLTSSGRLWTLAKVIQHSYDRLTRLWFDYSKIKSWMTFTDIR